MKRLLLVLAAGAALWTAACSSGGSSIMPPPPAGNFTLASLKGTYAFVTNGEVCVGQCGAATQFARTGSFTADGKGGISTTGGVYDIVNVGGSSTTASQPVAITGGSYTINADGRGTLQLNVNSNGAPTSITFGIVLTSGSSGAAPATVGLMIDETSNAVQASTGSGNFVLQSPASFQISAISGPYVFDFAGLDGNQPAGPESLVGQFNTTNAGVFSSGVIDANIEFGLVSDAPIGPGTLTADNTNMPTAGRGTATIAGQTYAFYIVDSTRVRFISINPGGAGPMLNGDAVAQKNTIPANMGAINDSFVFLVAGTSGSVSGAGGGLVRMARFTANGAALSKMLMDQNDNGTNGQFNGLSNGAISTYDPNTGRGMFSFRDSNNNTYSFVFYLSSASSGVIQDVSGGNVLAVADGSIEVQSGGPFSSSNITGSYAINWSGIVATNGAQNEEDILGQVKVSNLSLSGTSDSFQFTSNVLQPAQNIGTAGTITFLNGADGTGGDGHRVNLDVNLHSPTPVDFVVYIVSPQFAFIANRDNNGAGRIVAGVIEAEQ